jgi:AraC-like DNA-binding protein
LLRRTISNIINSHLLLRFKYERNDNLEEKIDSIQMKSPDEKLMERVIQIINRRLSDSNLSVDMIASEVGISRVHLYRKMKELTGQTPHEFIRNIRLKNAASLLVKKSMNVSEVTYACGFTNTASFSIIFKKFYGVSPRDYIKEQGQ